MFSIDLINTLLALWLKPMLVLVLLLIVSKYSYRFSAAACHWLLACALFSTFVATMVQYWLPGLHLSILPEDFLSLVNISLLSEDLLATIVIVLAAMYLLGIFWIASFQIFGLMDILIVLRSAKQIHSPSLLNEVKNLSGLIGVNKPIKIVESLDMLSPAVFGHRRPVLILPADYKNWPQGRLQRVLAHELSHVARGDWLAKMLAKSICAVLWSAPLVWYVADRLEWYAELACDDTVVRILDCRTEYAEDLMEISTDNPYAGWLMPFNRGSSVFLRIQHILDGRNQRSVHGLWSKVGNIVLCLLFAFPVSILHAVPRAPMQAVQPPSPELPFDVFVEKIDIHPIEEEPFNPKKLKSLIQVLHSSPRVTEEVVVTGDDRDRADLVAFIDKERMLLNSLQTDKLDVSMSQLRPQVEVRGALPIVLVTPEYPKRAIKRGIEGQVIAQFNIDSKGEIVQPQIVFASPQRIFNRSVLKALSQSKFTPMQIDGQPVAAKNFTETFVFKLQ